MSTQPAPPQPADAVLLTPIAVHLVFHVGPDWEAAREQAAAELEDKLARLTAYAKSREFKDRYGDRIGVLRLQTPAAPPSIVEHLLKERGVEVQLTGADAPAASEPCNQCQRTDFSTEDAAMTSDGWACPACFRAWSLRENPALDERPKAPLLLRLPRRVLFALLFLIAALVLIGSYYELTRLNKMNRLIKFHVGATE